MLLPNSLLASNGARLRYRGLVDNTSVRHVGNCKRAHLLGLGDRIGLSEPSGSLKGQTQKLVQAPDQSQLWHGYMLLQASG
jgi:hypothetical protein